VMLTSPYSKDLTTLSDLDLNLLSPFYI
jgi:hypothetical protein